MIDRFLNYLEYKHPFIFFLLFVLLVAIVVGIIIYAACAPYENKLKECYFQEPKTKECEFMLWKYENRDKNTHTTSTVPVYVYR